MAITLTSEQEQQAREITALRGFASVEEYLANLLNHTYETEIYFAENREEISAMIDEGWEEAERGELLTPEESKAQLEEMKREFLNKRSAA